MTTIRDERIDYVRPNSNLLLESSAAAFGSAVIAIVLSGYGCDGAEGIKAVRRAEGFVIAQNENSSGVFEMPHPAIQTRMVDLVLSLDQIAFALCVLTGASPPALRMPR